MMWTGHKRLRQRNLGHGRDGVCQRAARYYGLPAQMFGDLLRYGYRDPGQETFSTDGGGLFPQGKLVHYRR